MKNSQKSTTKLAYVVVALSLAMLSLIGALIGVLAATQINVNHSWTIGFQVGDHVAASVKMSYIVGGTTYIPSVYSANGGQFEQDNRGYVHIDTTTEVAAGTASPTAITLTKENPTFTVVFEVQEKVYKEGMVYGVYVALDIESSSDFSEYFDIEYWEKGAIRDDAPIETDAEGYSRYQTKSTAIYALDEPGADSGWINPVFWKVIVKLKDFNSDINNASLDISINLTSGD